jgi:hypothetical protein
VTAWSAAENGEECYKHHAASLDNSFVVWVGCSDGEWLASGCHSSATGARGIDKGANGTGSALNKTLFR